MLVYNSRMGKTLRAIIIAVSCCIVTLAGCSRFEPGRVSMSGPTAIGAVLDLRSWDFEKQGAVRLAGAWEFASGYLLDSEAAAHFQAWQIRAVPDFWDKAEGGPRPGTGAGTYRLRVLLPKSYPKLAIRNFTGFNAFELEVSGEIVARAGRPSLNPETAQSAYKPGVAPVEAQGGELVLLFRVSNYEYRSGGIWRCPP